MLQCLISDTEVRVTSTFQHVWHCVKWRNTLPIVVIAPTLLRWVDGGHWTKGAFSLVVVNPDFDLVRGEWRDALILEDVSRGVRGRDSRLHPTLCPEWAESHHVAKPRTALQLLGNRLRRKEMTQRDDSRWLILKIFIPKRIVAMHRLGHLEE